MADIGTDETSIIDYLKQYPHTFVSAVEVCKKAGGRKRFARDREWARPVLRRMAVDGWLEGNGYGQYKLIDEALGDKKCSKADRIARTQKAISQHVLSMDNGDDEKPFNVLIKEVVQSEYGDETSLFTKKK